jgi:hypothetical protein
MEPVAVQPGERLLLFVATTQAVPDMEFRVRWIGCGQTSDVIGDPSPGFAVGWPELAGPIAVSSASLGAVGYEARFERSTQEGVLLAMAPPGQGPITKAQLAYSQGSIELGPKPQFVAHQGGALAYTTTHVGSSDSAKSPLLVYFPLPLESIQGGYHRNATRIGET